MLTAQIERLFNAYVNGFTLFDGEAVAHCYLLPCSLSTPDKLVLIADDAQFKREFDDIFAQLNSAQVTSIKASKASYSQITEELVTVAVDWQFYERQGQIFTEFTALYQLAKQQGTWGIVNVISHDISQSVTLATPLTI